MRQLTGIVFLVVAFFNLFAGLGYVTGGALTVGLGGVVGYSGARVAAQADARGPGSGEERRRIAQGMTRFGTTVGLAGSGLLFLGVFILVSVGILIAGAVFLFEGRRPKFIWFASLVAVLVELIGGLLTAFGPTNLLGLAGGVLGFLSGRDIRRVELETALPRRARGAGPDGEG